MDAPPEPEEGGADAPDDGAPLTPEELEQQHALFCAMLGASLDTWGKALAANGVPEPPEVLRNLTAEAWWQVLVAWDLVGRDFGRWFSLIGATSLTASTYGLPTYAVLQARREAKRRALRVIPGPPGPEDPREAAHPRA